MFNAVLSFEFKIIIFKHRYNVDMNIIKCHNDKLAATLASLMMVLRYTNHGVKFMVTHNVTKLLKHTVETKLCELRHGEHILDW
jgi:hypothetical protein